VGFGHNGGHNTGPRFERDGASPQSALFS